MSHAGERITLLDPNLVRNVLVSSGKGYGLKRDSLYFINVLRRELYDRSDAIIVDGIDDRRHQSDFDAYTRQVFNRLLLYIEEVADAPMSILFFADPIELEIDAVLAGRFRGLAKLKVFGKANSVGRRQDSIEPDLLRISDRFKIISALV